jgi:hypothetical protein
LNPLAEIAGLIEIDLAVVESGSILDSSVDD